mmetsp:Transcript_26486/g.70286  ORF Transcript_26486/g.70286 Transcript_26486/m.70286 type:complete len:290 (-) Transcript_26486:329-1198(-)
MAAHAASTARLPSLAASVLVSLTHCLSSCATWVRPDTSGASSDRRASSLAASSVSKARCPSSAFLATSSASSAKRSSSAVLAASATSKAKRSSSAFLATSAASKANGNSCACLAACTASRAGCSSSASLASHAFSSMCTSFAAPATSAASSPKNPSSNFFDISAMLAVLMASECGNSATNDWNCFRMPSLISIEATFALISAASTPSGNSTMACTITEPAESSSETCSGSTRASPTADKIIDFVACSKAVRKDAFAASESYATPLTCKVNATTFFLASFVVSSTPWLAA